MLQWRLLTNFDGFEFVPKASGSGPKKNVQLSVVDPDPDVFGPPGSVSHNYGSGSGSFHHQAKIAEKP